jgi:hypothetical protein
MRREERRGRVRMILVGGAMMAASLAMNSMPGHDAMLAAPSAVDVLEPVRDPTAGQLAQSFKGAALQLLMLALEAFNLGELLVP